jgi:hypothetical protein
MGYSISLSTARGSAQANADYFGVPYVVFTDTSGRLRVEALDANSTAHKTGEVFYPQHVPDSWD